LREDLVSELRAQVRGLELVRATAENLSATCAPRYHVPGTESSRAELVALRLADLNLALTDCPPSEAPVWTGDMYDDCTARWCGLVLRAECMGCGDDDCEGEPGCCEPSHGENWWWAVSERVGGEVHEIDGSNERGEPGTSGEDARAKCVAAARKHLEANG
jgi:hypothetical protein